MDKNKRFQFILLALVLLIWGTVAWQLVDFSSTNNGAVNMDTSRLLNFGKNALPNDSFSLRINYKDPFLKKRYTVISSEKEFTKADRPASQIANAKTEKKFFPAVVYKGYSLNGNSIERVFLQINGQPFTMKKGDKNDGVELVNVEKELITVKWGNEARSIERKS